MRRVYRRRRLVALSVLAALIATPLLVVNLIHPRHGKGGDRTETAAVAKTTPAASNAVADQGTALPESKLVSHFRKPVPILMYHVIHTAPEGAANPGLFVPPRELRAEVRWLAHNGYTAVTLTDVFDAWHNGAKIPAHPIVLSFDDGTRDQHDTAAPILARYGWPGELNLPIESLNEHEMTDAMVEQMLGEGWELASHSRTHPDLTTVDEAALKDEVSGSRHALQRRFGVPVDFFCYPSGRYDDATIAAVKAAGYEGATTTKPGLAAPTDDPYELPASGSTRATGPRGSRRNSALRACERAGRASPGVVRCCGARRS